MYRHSTTPPPAAALCHEAWWNLLMVQTSVNPGCWLLPSISLHLSWRSSVLFQILSADPIINEQITSIIISMVPLGLQLQTALSISRSRTSHRKGNRYCSCFFQNPLNSFSLSPASQLLFVKNPVFSFPSLYQLLLPLCQTWKCRLLIRSVVLTLKTSDVSTVISVSARLGRAAKSPFSVYLKCCCK